ncbi:DegV family protein [Fusibacter ferrireducens]|uniref:DegV family protein n=1 Tax=Fusibacter ferrireducens TaxID=2785058 RepID=A0ABR9ZR31_9FIRM|nr:DegV family protein [Fusibacter ferrireducens]MBF4692400.1 DegV family protein [Fusibacter ferrireducens]
MRIVADSSCDLNEHLKKSLGITLVPLTITVGQEHFKDDANLDVSKMINAIEHCKEVAKSSCPSPQEFMNAFKDAGSVFVVTLTSALSGTYNSAMLAKDLYLKEYGDKFIHVFDSKGSSVKETLIAMVIKALIDEKRTEMEIVEHVNAYLEKQKFFFQLGSLDTMIKNGRITKLKGIIANALNIKPILYANEHGEVELYENVRSEKKSIRKLVEIIGEHCDDFSDRILGISHCEALEKAEMLKAEVEARYNFKKIVIVPTAGLSSVYTSRGGLTIAF